MPTLFKKLLFTGVIALFCASSFAQKGVEDGSKFGHGEDSLRCLKNYSLFTEYVKQKAYLDALPSWQIVYNECPLAGKSVYSDGIKIIEYRINKEKDKAKKDELISEMIAIYDQRIKYFGNDRKYNESWIVGRKATSLYKYKKSDRDSRIQIQEWLKQSIDARKTSSEITVLVTYMQNTERMYEAGQAGPEDMVNSYIYVNDILGQMIEKTSKESSKEKISSIKDNVEKLFATSGAADCETIEKIFGPQLAENTENLDWLKMVNKLLARADCEDAQLLYDISENLHVIEPSSSSAYGLARMYLKTQDLDKAVEYYNEAISLEEDPEQKGTFHYQLGLIMYNKGKLADARSNARKAIELRSDWGEPYILIGNLYAQSAKNFGSNEFEHKTAYWAAVDQFVKAKSVDSNSAAKANELIKLYSQYFPGTEEIFFNGLTVGSSYKLGGWINTSTKVRAK